MGSWAIIYADTPLFMPLSCMYSMVISGTLCGPAFCKYTTWKYILWLMLKHSACLLIWYCFNLHIIHISNASYETLFKVSPSSRDTLETAILSLY